MENQFELLDAAIAVTEALYGVEVEAFFTRGELTEICLYYHMFDFPIKSIEDLDEFIEDIYHAE